MQLYSEAAFVAYVPCADAEIFIDSKHMEFQRQVRSALRLLKEKSAQDFKTVERYIGRIREVETWFESGMLPIPEPPTFRMDRGTAFKSLTWAAGAIVHDACHSRLFHEYRKRGGAEYPPDEAWSGPKVELKCIALQIEAMRRLAAPAHEIAMLEKADGMHGMRAQWGL